MTEAASTPMADPADPDQRRLDRARQAYRDFHAQCFWSYRADATITPAKIPFVVRRLREHGGLAGYRVAAELCQ